MEKIKLFSLVVIIVMTLLSCNQKKDNTYQEVSAFSYDPEEAKELMEKHCYLCHSPIADELEGRIAPPMVAIKARYIDREGYNKAEFIENVKAFVANPTEEKALMYGAVKKHGLMPKQAFTEGSIEKIAAFMYDYQIEEPEWFKAHWEGHGNKNWTQSGKKLEEVEEVKTYADIGLDYALQQNKEFYYYFA